MHNGFLLTHTYEDEHTVDVYEEDDYLGAIAISNDIVSMMQTGDTLEIKSIIIG